MIYIIEGECAIQKRKSKAGRGGPKSGAGLSESKERFGRRDTSQNLKVRDFTKLDLHVEKGSFLDYFLC